MSLLEAEVLLKDELLDFMQAGIDELTEKVKELGQKAKYFDAIYDKALEKASEIIKSLTYERDELLNGRTVYNNSTPSMSVYFGSKLHKVIGEDDIVFDVVGMRFRYATMDDKKTQKVLLRNNKMICIPYNGDDSIQGVYEVEDEGKWFKLYKV